MDIYYKASVEFSMDFKMPCPIFNDLIFRTPYGYHWIIFLPLIRTWVHTNHLYPHFLNVHFCDLISVSRPT